MLKDGQIDWVETLAQIANDKGEFQLAHHIRNFGLKNLTHFTSQQGVEDIVKDGRAFNITKMPEATCDGCQ